MNPQVATWAEREDLSRRFDELDDPWPEFMHHDAVVGANWGAMRERFPHLQIVLFDADDGERPIGRGQTMPVRWDGTLDGLPGGVDDATLQAVALADGEADTLSAMVASLDPRVRGQGLSRLIIDGMRRAAAAAGLKALIAPVRPTMKQLYPLVPMERYVEWRARGRAALRPVAAAARAARRGAAPGRAALDDDRGHGRRVGGVGGDGLPGERRVRGRGRARARRDRP